MAASVTVATRIRPAVAPAGIEEGGFQVRSSCTGGDRRRAHRGRGVERRRRADGAGAQAVDGARRDSNATRKGKECGPTHCV
eukprot:3564238-Pleurochrysis_carterae.AAC.5